MNIYLVEQTINDGLDVYQSMVVAAMDEIAAKNIHPSGYLRYTSSGWQDVSTGKIDRHGKYDWVSVDKLDTLAVKKIGVSDLSSEKVILSSYR